MASPNLVFVLTFDDPHAVASVILGTTAWALDEQRREVKR